MTTRKSAVRTCDLKSVSRKIERVRLPRSVSDAVYRECRINLGIDTEVRVRVMSPIFHAIPRPS